MGSWESGQVLDTEEVLASGTASAARRSNLTQDPTSVDSWTGEWKLLQLSSVMEAERAMRL